jgi:photosystem II stability/assembly factor-like uncharacterized protein
MVGAGKDSEAILTTANGGTTWKAEPVPSGVSFLNTVSCGSTSDCVAVGQAAMTVAAIVSTTDGGAKWTTAKVPAGVRSLYDVSSGGRGYAQAVGTSSDDIVILGEKPAT